MVDRSGDSNEKWYLKPIFTSFWNHYNQCNQWLEQSGHKMVEFSDEIDDIDCHNCPKCEPIPDNINTADVESTTDEDIDRSNQRMDALESIEDIEFNGNPRKVCEELIPFDDNEVMQISDEYLEFALKTKRHQIERKKLREKRLRYNERVEYVDISRLDSFSRKGIAPKRFDRSHVNRTNDKELSAQKLKQQKMFELYGEDYNVIQGMEAALQLNFDRLCDLHQPKFWPIMPIRMPSKQI